MTGNGIRWLALKKEHLRRTTVLPWVHRDPFDRLLVAQALCEELTILTADQFIPRYAAPTVW